MSTPEPPPYSRVTAHRPDRMRTVVVGVLLPYNVLEGERVKDDDGVTWHVVADSIRSAEPARFEAGSDDADTVERVAKVLYGFELMAQRIPWEQLSAGMQSVFSARARAAIAALKGTQS